MRGIAPGIGHVVAMREKNFGEPAQLFDRVHADCAVQRGASTMALPASVRNRNELAPQDERALKPRRHTRSVIGSGKTLGGACCVLALWIDAVGHRSRARHACVTSPALSGWRTNTHCPPRSAMRPGATFFDAPQSMQVRSTYQSPGAFSG